MLIYTRDRDLGSYREVIRVVRVIRGLGRLETRLRQKPSRKEKAAKSHATRSSLVARARASLVILTVGIPSSLFWWGSEATYSPLSPAGSEDKPMTEETPRSAFAAMRALRDEMRARLDRNEDYRAWKALDDALRELDPPRLPTVGDFAVETSRMASVLADIRDSGRTRG